MPEIPEHVRRENLLMEQVMVLLKEQGVALRELQVQYHSIELQLMEGRGEQKSKIENHEYRIFEMEKANEGKAKTISGIIVSLVVAAVIGAWKFLADLASIAGAAK